jgi:riboflavin transporter FmnP
MRVGLIQAIEKDLKFALVCAVVVLCVIVIANVVEKKALKGNITPIKGTYALTFCAMQAALATILFLFEFPLPFLAPSFYELDFSEVPVMIGAFYLGPVAGVTIEMLKILLKLVMKGTSTAFVGDLANFVVGCSFVLPASIIYHIRKNKNTAILGLGVGTICMTIFGSAFNAIYLLPAFSKLYGIPLDQLVAMGTAINSRIDSVTTLVLFAVAPLNLIKGVMISVPTLLLYKRISKVLHSASVGRHTRK